MLDYSTCCSFTFLFQVIYSMLRYITKKNEDLWLESGSNWISFTVWILSTLESKTLKTELGMYRGPPYFFLFHKRSCWTSCVPFDSLCLGFTLMSSETYLRWSYRGFFYSKFLPHTLIFSLIQLTLLPKELYPLNSGDMVTAFTLIFSPYAILLFFFFFLWALQNPTADALWTHKKGRSASVSTVLSLYK